MAAARNRLSITSVAFCRQWSTCRTSDITRSAVPDRQNQTQDVAGLSRDTDNANGHIDKIFDKEKVENQMAFAQGAQELAGKVAADWAIGGTYSMVASAVAGALGGLSAGNLGAAASGAMAPYIANEIKQKTTTCSSVGSP
ncbi:hypothetical protein [Pantoea cypripedii]|uniref:Uncharacterized protein n=1 Tax=Pantoea cypripedii TaxID=55209 RepID=A0A1X1EMP6_PANCY|nr:hypothetical protein [Pantoea cypripedii]MBP2199120.1 hypothetical protein [Pantoea cypripedii]ORM90227.1 hypothetical protein HA50_27220 [Pantoea cypripedii]